MVLLGPPTGYYDYLNVSIFGIVIVITLLIIGLWYMYKSRVIKKGSAIPILCVLLGILVPVLIIFMPSFLGHWSVGFTRATTVLLWGLGIVAVVFVIFIYLVHSKKKILKEKEVQAPETEK